MDDYLIVGAGSAGCVLANRLSADGAAVRLIEAGGSDDSPLIRTPGLYSALHDSVYDWGYRTVPQARLNGRRIFCPRGRVLGGSSSINYMMYVRGNRGDYDHWAGLGNAGWSYNDVLPYFVRSERNSRFGPPYHGTDGLLDVADPPHYGPLVQYYLEAAEEAQLHYNQDPNGAHQEGSCHYQATIGLKGRASTAVAFLEPARSRPNLAIVSNSLVTRVLLHGTRAIGVEYLDSGGLHVVHAGEIILCGGAFNSPQLLMLSGIGDPTELTEAGIAVRHELPGVGKNLQDHLNVRIHYEIDEPLTLFGMSSELADQALLEFAERGTGPFAWNYLEAGGFIKCDLSEAYPDVQFFFVPSFGTENPDGSATDRHGFMIGGYVNRPKSRGTVRLASASPFDRPTIDPNYLSEGDDLRLTIAGLRRFRTIGCAPAFRAIGAREIHPGPDVSSDEALSAHVRRIANTTWHQVGTCKMGIDEMAVVDPMLRVQGIDRLRVVDASVMPAVPSGNTNAPTIMIAEKAADLILQGRKQLPAGEQRLEEVHA
jgi:choline dehydrogenase